VFAGSGITLALPVKACVFEADCTRTSSLIIKLADTKRPLHRTTIHIKPVPPKSVALR